MADPAPRLPLAEWLSQHGKGILALVAAVATALFATTHSVFYGSLDVGIRDVGLGPVEVLSQAALGIVVVGGLYGFFVIVCSAIYAYARGPGTDPLTAVTLGALTVLGVLVGMGTGAIFAVVLSTTWPLVVALLGSVATLFAGPAIIGWTDRGKRSGSTDRRMAATTVGIVFVVMLVALAAVTAADDASLVRRGIPPDSVFHPLAGGPVPCVQVTGLGTLPASVPALAMHLGEAGGRVVLYAPGRGVVRVPAGDVVIAAADDDACRLG